MKIPIRTFRRECIFLVKTWGEPVLHWVRHDVGSPLWFNLVISWPFAAGLAAVGFETATTFKGEKKTDSEAWG